VELCGVRVLICGRRRRRRAGTKGCSCCHTEEERLERRPDGTDDDDQLSAELSNGSPVPPLCSECVEERIVLELLQVQRGAQLEWIRGSGRQESLSGNHVPQPCPFLAAEFHGTSGYPEGRATDSAVKRICSSLSR